MTRSRFLAATLALTGLAGASLAQAQTAPVAPMMQPGQRMPLGPMMGERSL